MFPTRYLREKTIRRAIVTLVDYHTALPLSSSFGPGTMAMSDGIRFEVSSRVLHAKYHGNDFRRRRGVTLHDMTSDQYSQPYIQIISPHMREAHAALDARPSTTEPKYRRLVNTMVRHSRDEAQYPGWTRRTGTRFGFVLHLAKSPPSHLSGACARTRYVNQPLFRGPPIQRELITRCWE